MLDELQSRASVVLVKTYNSSVRMYGSVFGSGQHQEIFWMETRTVI